MRNAISRSGNRASRFKEAPREKSFAQRREEGVRACKACCRRKRAFLWLSWPFAKADGDGRYRPKQDVAPANAWAAVGLRSDTEKAVSGPRLRGGDGLKNVRFPPQSRHSFHGFLRALERRAPILGACLLRAFASLRETISLR